MPRIATAPTGDEAWTRPAEARWVRGTALGMAVVLALLSVTRHRLYLSGGFDLGFYIHNSWQIAHGRWNGSLGGYHVLADHLSPVLIPLGVVMLLPGSTVLVLVGQAAVVGWGVLPAFRLGDRLAGRLGGELAVVWYATSATLWFATLFDFHPSVAAVPVLLQLCLLVERSAGLGTIVAAELVLVLLREDVALLGALVILAGAVQHRRRDLLVLFAVAASIPVGYVALGTRLFGPGYTYALRYGSFGQTPGAMITGLPSHLGLVFQRLTDGWAIGAYVGILAPMLFLPLAGWRRSWPGLGLMVVNLLADSEPVRSINFQYYAPALPFLVWGALHALRGVLQRPGAPSRVIRTAAIAIAATVFISIGPPLGDPDASATFRGIFSARDRTALDAVIAHTPDGVEVAASETLVAHLARRERIYSLPTPLICTVGLIGLNRFRPDYVVVDTTDRGEPSDSPVSALPALGYTVEWSNEVGAVWRRVGERGPDQPCPKPNS